MERITGSAVSVDLFGAGKNGFKNGDKVNGIPATIVTADFLNSIQEEISNVIESTGVTLNLANRTQLKQAISVMLAGANTIARFTTTGNITLSGLGTQGGGDWGAGLTAGDVILVKNQSTASQNGWYAAAAGAWTRVVYLDEAEEVKPSTLTKVSEGATLADTMWMLTTNAPITVGATNLAFVQKDSVAGIQLSDFTGTNQQLAANGYQKLPGGLILQWVKTPSVNAGAEYTLVYPIAFPNACICVLPASINSASTQSMNAWVIFSDPTATQVVLTNGTATNGPGFILLLGY